MNLLVAWAVALGQVCSSYFLILLGSAAPGARSSHGGWRELKSQAEPYSAFQGAYNMPLTFYWSNKCQGPV